MEWISVDDKFPKDCEIVKTKIDDLAGIRNEQDLKKVGDIWFLPDGSMYVYYKPTHWMPLPEPPNQTT